MTSTHTLEKDNIFVPPAGKEWLGSAQFVYAAQNETKYKFKREFYCCFV